MPFAETWKNLEIIMLSEVRETQTSYDTTYMWNPKKEYKWTYLQNRNRLTDFENKTYGYQRGQVGSRDGLGFGLAYAHCGIEAFCGFCSVSRFAYQLFHQLGVGFLASPKSFNTYALTFELPKFCCCYFLSRFLCLGGFIYEKIKPFFPCYFSWVILVGFGEVIYLDIYI